MMKASAYNAADGHSEKGRNLSKLASTKTDRQFNIFHSSKLPYRGTLVRMQEHKPIEIERVQTGVRIEKRLLKVLKAVAELKDMTLGDLLEGIVLHAFEGKTPFSPQTLKEIEQFKSIYGMTLRAADSHNLKERQ